MERVYKAYLTLVLTEEFNIMVYKNVPVYFAVTNRHQNVYLELYYEGYVLSLQPK